MPATTCDCLYLHSQEAKLAKTAKHTESNQLVPFLDKHTDINVAIYALSQDLKGQFYTGPRLKNFHYIVDEGEQRP
jgi:hypothetical protein